MTKERLIKKYANRRLYDASISKHVTLEDIRDLIVSGEKIEPKPIKGKAGSIPVKVQAAHDDGNLYLRFAWKQPPYEYEAVKLPIDILCGTDRVRRAIEAGVSPRYSSTHSMSCRGIPVQAQMRCSTSTCFVVSSLTGEMAR